MVDLPHGKMKSREGTVVDADDLMREMSSTAAKIAEELGKLEGMSPEDKAALYHTIGLGALKYFILKVDPKKRIFYLILKVLWTLRVIQDRLYNTLMRGFNRSCAKHHNRDHRGSYLNRGTRKGYNQAPIRLSGSSTTSHWATDPALIANYSYDLVKLFNSFYQNIVF